MEYEDLQRLSGHFCNLGEDELRLIFSLAKFHPKNFAQDTYMLQISGIGNFICRKYLYSVSTKQYYSNICNTIVPDIVESLS